MPGMPLARIYASIAEEAEPLRADLFARGYNVEIVFPDAAPTGSADLELRLEHCSPALAIARVEQSGGHPSRCVFLTGTRNQQGDLILIEMTVAATGTHGRHPIYGPSKPPIANPVSARGSIEPVERHDEEMEPAQVIELSIPVAGTAAKPDPAPIPDDRPDPTRNLVNRERDDDWDKLVAAEVTAFLAHAPHVEPRKLFPVDILRCLRSSQVAEPGRNRLRAWAMVGMASSMLLILSLVWHAGQSRPSVGQRQAAASTVIPTSAAGLLVSPPTPKRRNSVSIAQDTVVQVGYPIRKVQVLRPIPAADKNLISGFAAERASPVQTSSVRTDTAPIRPSAIPKVTDSTVTGSKITDLK